MCAAAMIMRHKPRSTTSHRGAPSASVLLLKRLSMALGTFAIVSMNLAHAQDIWFRPESPTSLQSVGLLASVPGNGCTEDAVVSRMTRHGNLVEVEYTLVPPLDGRGCFLPPPASLRAALGTFEPGHYTIRIVNAAGTLSQAEFVVAPPSEKRAYARLELLAGDRQIVVAGKGQGPPGERLAPFRVRALDDAGEPIAGLQLAMLPALNLGGPMLVDAFGYVGFNTDETIRGRSVSAWVIKPPFQPYELTTTDADGVATLQPADFYNFAPGSLLFGVAPATDIGSAAARFFSFVAVDKLPAGDPRVAVEFFHEPSGNYFVTQSDDEIRMLDAGAFAGWKRSIGSFIVYSDAAAPDGTVPVCRFFSAAFTSHFYTASPAECDEVVRRWPHVWQLETRSAFRVFVPNFATGECPADTRPVYRLYNAKAAVNHRYVTDATLRDRMAQAGWVPEGGGPDAVAMCTPG